MMTLDVAAHEPTSYLVQVGGPDLSPASKHVELSRGKQAELEFALTIAHSRELTFNYDGEDPFKDERKLQVEIRDAAGLLVRSEDLVAKRRHLRLYRYWELRHVFARGQIRRLGTARLRKDSWRAAPV